MNKECLFCGIYSQKTDLIFEDNFFFAQFDKFPVSVGHAEIIPIRHTDSLLDLSENEWESLQRVLSQTVTIIKTSDFQKVYDGFLKNPINESSERFLKKALESDFIHKKPDGYNFGINDGEAAGRTIHHLHIHIIPRYCGDVSKPSGGIRRVIPNMGNY